MLDVWMEGDHWIKDALTSMNVTNYMEMVRLIEDPNTVNSIKNRKGDGTEESISPEKAQKFRCCLSYANQLQLRHGPIADGLVDITQMDDDDFRSFYIMAIPFVTYDDFVAEELQSKREARTAAAAAAAAQRTGSQGVTTATNSNPSTTSSANSNFNSELAAFRKNIKLDATLYPTLSADANWHAFTIEWTALSNVFRLDHVLDPNYVPATTDQQELFDAQQAFFMTVMLNKIKTIKGKEIVNNHIASGDAQAAWKDLVAHYRGAGSIISKQRGDDLYEKINTPIPSDKPVRLTAAISQWEKDLSEYLAVTSKKLPSDEKLRLFERFLRNISQLKSVVTMHSMIASVNHSTNVTTAIDPEATINLYKSRSEEIDIESQNKAVKQRRRIVQELTVVSQGTAHMDDGFYQVNVSDLTNNSMPDEQWFDVFLSSQGDVKAEVLSNRMPLRVWKSLTREEQGIWDQLSDVTKGIILNCRMNSPLPIKPVTRRRVPSRSTFRRERRNDPNSAGRDRKSPIAQHASINVNETLPPPNSDEDDDLPDDDDTQLVANLAAITEQLDMPARDWDDEVWNDTRLINSLRRDDGLDVHQTSHLPPFSMERFLSQPDDDDATPTDDEDILQARHTELYDSDEDYDGDGVSSVVSNLMTPSDDLYQDAAYSICTSERVLDEPVTDRTTYSVSAHRRRNTLALVDRGANGGVAGADDVKVISRIPHSGIDIQGIDNHTLQSVQLGSVGGVAQTQRGEVILIFKQYALLERGRTIHSAIQLENFGNEVSDTAVSFGGQQRLLTPTGYAIPLDISNGLATLNTRPFTDDEWGSLPHVEMTSNSPWNPRVHDANVTNDPDWLANQPIDPLPDDNFNAFGEYLHRTEVSMAARGSPNGSVARVALFDSGSNLGVAARSYEVPLDLPSSPPSIDIQVTDAQFHAAHDVAAHHRLYSTVATYADLMTGHHAQVHERRERPADLESYRQFFLNAPREVIQHTFAATTQYYRAIPATNRILDTRRSHYPAANHLRRHERVAADAMFFDVEAIGGSRCCQFYIGRSSFYMAVHGMRTDGEFVNTFEDEIRLRGAMDGLITDRAQSEISRRVKDILRNLFIRDWQSEPHHQNQNIAERYIQELKRHANFIRNRTGAPPEFILMILQYICFIWNRTARRTLGWRTPCEALTGQTPDISMLLHFHFWQRVYIGDYRESGTGFPSQSNEILCYFVGFSETVGHSMTFKVYNPTTRVVLHRSRLRAATPDDSNHPSNPPPDPDDDPNAGSDSSSPDNNASSNDGNHPTASTPRNNPDGSSSPNGTAPSRTPAGPSAPEPSVQHASELKPEDLLGRTVLKKRGEDGTRLRAKIVDLIEQFEGERDSHPDRVKFRCKVGDEEFEELLGYNEMCELIEDQVAEEDGTWRFIRIAGHTTPTKRSETPKVLVEWETGEITLESTFKFAKTNKHEWIVAEYARDNDLLDEWDEIWPSLKLKQKAKNAKKLIRQINQAKRVSYKAAPVYMFGYEVPRNHDQAVRIDQENGNRLWQDSEELEVKQLMDYETFIDKGHKSTSRPPDGYKKITLHFVYAVKHDGRHKSRIVAGGHLTDAPVESVYSGVVSLRGVRFTVFLAELNDLKVYQTDVGNAYLEAFTKEKVYVIAGPEFAEIQGHVLIISRALYGLKSSGLRWYERFADVLRDMGFSPCPAEPEIWMRACNADGTVIRDERSKSVPLKDKKSFFDLPKRVEDGSYYEYIAVYCDDLTIASKDPKGSITSVLEQKYKFKLKGTAPLNYLLGCDYYREGKVLCAAPKRYIEKMETTYLQLFGEKPSQKMRSPLEKGDNPELDTTDFLDEKRTKIYQSMVGAAQWIISLGRFDIAVHIMTLSSFRSQPRKGHLERMKRVYGYLSKMKHAAIRFRTDMPDVSDHPFLDYDWSNSPYAGAREELPPDLPIARGKPVLMTSFVDANLCHDLLSGRSVTGVLHFFNKSPVDWFSKKQNTVETATFGSENNAARAAVEQIKANKLTLLQLGVPLQGAPILLGDNKSVVDSGTQPHGKLHKRHLMLSYHFVRENIAAGVLRFAFIRGPTNPADTLSKHWAYSAVWPLIRPILFWSGDTMDILDQKKGVVDRES